MIYDWYESQRAILSPLADFAQAASKFYTNPLWPLSQSPSMQRVSASYELMHRLLKSYEKPQFGIPSVRIGEREVAVQEQIALDKPFCRLLRFKRFSDDHDVLQQLKSHPTVLIVAPLSGHHAEPDGVTQ